MSDRVVVTGLGAVTPLGATAPETWAKLLAGAHGIRLLDDPAFTGLPVRIGAPVTADLTTRLDRKRARILNRASRFAVVAAREAWADAGLTGAGSADPHRVAVSLGTINPGAAELMTLDRVLATRGARHVSPHAISMIVPSSPASAVAMDLDVRGEARTVSSACASGTEAIAVALDRIRLGHVDVAIAGGTEGFLNPAAIAGLAAMRAMTPARSPERASRPFDRDRDGFVLGEGAGLLILESAGHARARGARVYCEVAGYGLSSDAFHMVAPRPDGAGVRIAVHKALADAGAEPADVVHVNAHATSTVLGDAVEAALLRDLFGHRPPVTAPKGALGHLQGAAGGVEAVIAALTVHHRVVPPTAGTRTVDDDVDLVLERARSLPEPGPAAVALSMSYGFGGHNAVLALRRP
ncbi:beta-ketoacyl synthase [Actinoplanes sp. L3-i22]|uniref:beta-ketoacyl-[acyl-carrier-protein] synthase family protein n=1 Tax=Actinoplanes sp. L3-i22 TaxID=2836373 RepID=UPI001C792A37|nr:beta-ketoacyl-[acyl-carrier-protein] synthase family protein [Actinoplanes sp. L3-i22]BCY09688.1 3-oxoacyl-ACP synthase [Actinoplanes sp. L3-i22]